MAKTDKGNMYVSPYGVKHPLYTTIEGTINPATTTSLAFSSPSRGYEYYIINDGSVAVTVKLDASTNPAITIGADEMFFENKYLIESPIYMYNATTTSTDYRIFIEGF